MLKTVTLKASLATLACSMSIAAHAMAQTPRLDIPAKIDVPAGDLTTALATLAKESGLEFVYSADQLKGLRTEGVHGKYTPQKAVTKLLEGTKLKLTQHESGALLISDASGAGAPVATSDAGYADPKGMATQANKDILAEIVVTAQKRSEPLQDVPVPVTALNADALIAANQIRLQDYFYQVPGLNLITDQFSGAPIVSIRGVTTGSGNNPTVGITVDDVPYGSSTSLGEGFVAPDLDPSELERVEILRGPQGTLYGASSLGGLIKYVTVDPSTDRLFGFIQGGVSTVQNGDGAGYSVRGSVNVPINDTLAIRASGFTRIEPGYVDDPSLHKQGVNRRHADGGRLSALWRPSDSFSLKLSALLQESRRNGLSLVNVGPGFGDLQQSALRGTGEDDRKFQAYSATVGLKLGSIDLTSISGYNKTSASYPIDLTSVYGPSTFGLFGTTGTREVPHVKSSKFTQEIRLSSAIGEQVEWLLGGFYTHESSHNDADIFAVDPVSGATVGLGLNSLNPSTVSEYAAFANLTYHFTQQFDVQVGGRESQIKQGQGQFYSGPFNVPVLGSPSDPFTYPSVHVKEHSFTYLVTPRLRFSDDLMAYARLASGYRAGGANLVADPSSTVPSRFKPDKTLNYELGIKGNALDHRLSFDGSIYYIDWKDVQLLVLDPTFVGYYANAGRAKSQGLELSVQAQPYQGLKVAAWGAWNDAELRSVASASFLNAASGDRLPYSSRFSGNLSIDQEITVTSNMTAVGGASLSYVGKRIGVFENIFVSPERQNFPSYTQVDLHAGVRYNDWSGNLFVGNLTNRRGVLTGGLGTFNPTTFDYIQPRSIGLSVTRNF